MGTRDRFHVGVILPVSSLGAGSIAIFGDFSRSRRARPRDAQTAAPRRRPTAEIAVRCNYAGRREPDPALPRAVAVAAGDDRSTAGYAPAPSAFARASVASRVDASGGAVAHPARLAVTMSASAEIHAGCSLRQGIA